MTAPVTDNAVLKLLNVESAYGPIKAIRGVGYLYAQMPEGARSGQ